MGSVTSECPDFGEITDWAFSLLTMRINTPGGEWLPADFERVYAQGWSELEGSFGAASASEAAILDLANIGMHLVDYLVAETGQPAEFWLARLHRDYVRLGRDQEGL